MKRPTKFEHYRWVGDRRTQVVYDLDSIDDEALIMELLKDERVENLSGVKYMMFGPDTLAEARNRGYKPYKGNGSGKPEPDED